MKTFRLVSLAIHHQSEQPNRLEEIPLIDGLIINKEDGENRWIVEAHIEKEYKTPFEMYLNKDEAMTIQVTITKKTNEPASVLGNVKLIKLMENSVSILLEGTLLPSKHNKAEHVLTDLIEQGLHGKGLLHEFKIKMEEPKKKSIEGNK